MRSLFSALFIIGIASAANDTNMLAEQSVVDDDTGEYIAKNANLWPQA